MSSGYPKKIFPLPLSIAFLMLFPGTLRANPTGHTIAPTPFYMVRNHKSHREGILPAGARFVVVGRAFRGKWLPIVWKGKRGWIPLRLASVQMPARRARRNLASTDTTSPFSAHADLGIESGGIGLGLGVGGWVRVPSFIPSLPLRLDLGPSIYYFPSASGATVFEILGEGRLMYMLGSGLGIGGELGLTYVNVSLSSASASSIGIVLGGALDYQLSSKLSVSGGLRLLEAGGAAGLLFTAGIIYQF